MRLEQFRAMLPDHRPSGPGFIAHCPACGGRRRKLSVREGEKGLLVKCWAACSLNDICSALGIPPRDLFFDSEVTYRSVNGRRERPSPKPWRLNWRRVSVDFMNYADALHERGTSVLALATDVQDRHAWSEDDLDAAMKAVAQAYEDVERSSLLEAVGFDLRAAGLQWERMECRR